MKYYLFLFSVSVFVYQEKFSFFVLTTLDMFLDKKQQSFYNESLNIDIPMYHAHFFQHDKGLIKVISTS